MAIGKIAILNDEDITTYIGGAALVNERIKQKLISINYDCEVLLFNKNFQDQFNINSYDFFILGNIAYIPKSIIEQIIESKKPYIRICHDIPVIIYTRPPSILFRGFYQEWQRLFDNAYMNIFISKMQKKVFEQVFDFKDDNSIIMPPPLNLEGFENKNNPNRNGCLYLGDISMARGLTQTLEVMKSISDHGRMTFAGKLIDEKLKDYLIQNGATYIGEVKHEDVPKLMNEHKYFFYFPEIYDSFCLKIVEAELCGMKIYADNYRIGRYTYDANADQLKEQITTISLDQIINMIKVKLNDKETN